MGDVLLTHCVSYGGGLRGGPYLFPLLPGPVHATHQGPSPEWSAHPSTLTTAETICEEKARSAPSLPTHLPPDLRCRVSVRFDILPLKERPFSLID